MKKIITMLCAAVMVSVSAAELKVQGDFVKLQKNGMPMGWSANSWSGYKPAPKFEIVEGDGAKALHFTEINAKYGFCWVNWQRYPAKAGDVVKVTAKVKGSGFAWVQLQTCLADGKYTGAIPQSVIRLTPEWRDVEIEIAVTDIKDKVTGKVMLTFGAKKGADFYISHIKADLTDGK